MSSIFRDTGAPAFDEAVQAKARELSAHAQITEHHTHHFTLTRPGRDSKVTAESSARRVSQAYVNEIAAHVLRVEADPIYSAPLPFKRWPA
jgi:hypothetical protein